MFSIVAALLEAYPEGRPREDFASHKVICRAAFGYNLKVIKASEEPPPGYSRLSLNQIVDLVEEELLNISTAHKVALAKRLAYMASHKKEKDEGCFAQILAILARIGNLLAGYGYCTSNERAEGLQKKITKKAEEEAAAVTPATTPVVLDTPYPNSHPLHDPQSYRYRQDAYATSLVIASAKKYQIESSGQVVVLDDALMLSKTKLFNATGVCTKKKDEDPYQFASELFTNEPSESGSFTLHSTTFAVLDEDPLEGCARLSQEGKNPAILVDIHPTLLGGVMENGDLALEKDIGRRSNLVHGMQHLFKDKPYQLPEFGGVYMPGISVFRRKESEGFAFMAKPATVTAILSAPYSFKAGGTGDKLSKTEYIHKTKEKLRHIFGIALMEKHLNIVLVPWGCGSSYGNSPTEIAHLMQDVLEEAAFFRRFQGVFFAISADAEDGSKVVITKVCEQMTEKVKAQEQSERIRSGLSSVPPASTATPPKLFFPRATSGTSGATLEPPSPTSDPEETSSSDDEDEKESKEPIQQQEKVGPAASAVSSSSLSSTSLSGKPPKTIVEPPLSGADGSSSSSGRREEPKETKKNHDTINGKIRKQVTWGKKTGKGAFPTFVPPSSSSSVVAPPKVMPSGLIRPNSIRWEPRGHLSLQERQKKALVNLKKAIIEACQDRTRVAALPSETDIEKLNDIPTTERTAIEVDRRSLRFTLRTEDPKQPTPNQDSYLYFAGAAGYVFGVFDGHAENGEKVAKDAVIWSKEALQQDKSYETGVVDYFLAIEKLCHNLNDKSVFKYATGGATLVISIIDADSQECYTGTLGNCEARLYRKFGSAIKCVPLSCVRNWASKSDANRRAYYFTDESLSFAKLTPSIDPDRLRFHPDKEKMKNGEGLNISRAIGDKDMRTKKLLHAITSKPKITRVMVKPGDWIISATDGLWKVLTDAEIITLIQQAITGEGYETTLAPSIRKALEDKVDVDPKLKRDDVAMNVLYIKAAEEEEFEPHVGRGEHKDEEE